MASTNAIPLVTKGRSQADTPANVNANYFLGIDATTGTLVADFEDTTNGGNHPVTGITAIPISATWHHAAVTYDTATDTWNLYLDGNLERTLSTGGNFTPESTSIQHAALGTAIDANAAIAGFFNGALDEVRFWNVARTQAQIQATKDQELSSGTGLVARYGLNEGSGSSIASSVAGAPNGALAPAAGPAWVAGAPVSPPAANQAPVFSTDLGDLTLDEGAAINLDANATDADLNPLTYSALGLPSGISINATTGVISGTLADGTNGSHPITVTVSDGSLTDQDTFTLTVNDVDMPPAAPVGLTATAGDGSVSLAWTANGEADLAGYHVYRGTSLPVSTVGPSLNGTILTSASFVDTSAINNTQYHYVVVAQDANGGRSAASTAASATPSSSAGTALDFDGTNDRVAFGAAPSLGVTNFTVETWFRRDGAGVGVTTGTGGITAIPLVTKGGAEGESPANLNMNWFLGIDSTTGVLVADFEDTTNGGNHPVSGVTAIPAGPTWHHAAVTYDTATDTWNLYLNGNLERTLAVGNFTPEASSIQHGALATSLNSTGAPAQATPGFFNGALDEVRVWNVARTQAPDPGNANAAAHFRRRADRPMGPERRRKHVRRQLGCGRGERNCRQRSAVGRRLPGPDHQSGTGLQHGHHRPDRRRRRRSVASMPTRPMPTSTRSPTPRRVCRRRSINTGTGVISGTLSGSAAGTHNVTVTVSDGTATDTDTFTWTVSNTNQAPVFTTDLGDRTDTEGAGVNLDADAIDGDLQTLTYSATGLPGGVSINTANGSITGTLSNSSSGTHAVTITVSDGTDTDTDTFTWTVTNTNQAPVFSTDITDQSDAEGDAVSLDADATDPDLDTLTYSATGLPGGISINPTTGVISGTLNSSSSGSHDVTVTVSDGTDTDTDTFTWTVAGVNQAPVFSTDITDQTDAEGTTVSLDADATDPDLDPLTYSATGLPGGVTISPTTGVISGTLSTTSAGTHNVTITVSDGPDTDTDTFTWTVSNTNQAPAFTTDLLDQTDAEGAAINLDADAIDGDLDSLTYSATGLPGGVSINTANGAITGTLSFSSAGSHNVTVTVSDGTDTDTDSFSWTVTATNQAPVFSTDIPDQSDDEGDVVSLDADATDGDLDGLTYGATGLPGGVSISPTTGVISGTLSNSSSGIHNVTITVSDGTDTDTDTFTWTVAEPVTGSGLDFDGVDDHVTFGSAPGLNSNTFTIETWFRRDGTGTSATTSGSGGVTAIPLVTKGLSESGQVLSWFLGIDSGTGRLAADFESASDDSNHPLIGTTTLTNGTWYHGAITYDGTTFRLFLNGTQEASVAIGNGPGTAGAHHAALGTAMTSTGAATGRFDGALDEVRIWNVARSAAQLAGRRTQELAAGTGLLARYGLNEAAGSSVANSVAGGVNGTAVGGVAWGGGAPIGPATNAAPEFSTDLANRTNPEGTVVAGLDADATDADGDTLTYSATGLPGGATINAATGVISGTLSSTSSGIHNVTVTVSDGVATDTDTFTWTVTDVAVNNALDFDGTNDHVTFGAATAGLGVQSFTIETWFRRDGAGVAASTGAGGITNAIPLVTKGRSEADGSNVDANYFLGIDGATGTLVADFEDNATGLNHPVTGVTAIPVSATVWHHAAVTYDTATDTWNLYLNGNLERTLPSGGELHPTLGQHPARGPRHRHEQHRRTRRVLQRRARRGSNLERRPHPGADPGGPQPGGHVGHRPHRPLRLE